MEAFLLLLIFHIASSLLAYIVEHLAKDEFKGVVTYCPSFSLTGDMEWTIASITDIERRAEEVTRVLCGITIPLP